MTKYERIVRTVNRRVTVIRVGDKSCVYIDGKRRCVYGPEEAEAEAVLRCADIRAAFIADMCRVANVKTPKARKR